MHNAHHLVTRVFIAFLLLIPLVVSNARPSAAAFADVPAAVQAGVDNAAANGVTQYVAVLDRRNGQLIAGTANDQTQVASESVMKLFIAAYYLRAYGGVLPAQLDSDLRTMIIYSDDSLASQYWNVNAIPSVAAAYGLTGSNNDPTRAGYWGAARITALDMVRFLWGAANDPAVGNWLFSAMSATADSGSDGYDQNFGFNAIPGAGSKQGWGCDSYWVGPCAIHSVGFTDTVLAAVLQTGPSTAYSVMPSTATTTANNIVSAASTQSPIGNFESSSSSALSVSLTGWALDPDARNNSISVAVYRDGVGLAWFPTDVLRPDVNAGNAATGSHGFAIALAGQPPGSHSYCIYGIDATGDPNISLGCRTVEVGLPTGSFGSATASGNAVQLTGWAYDPQTLSGPISVALYRNGVGVGWFSTTVNRPDVNAAFGLTGTHGFSISLPAEQTGDQTYCIYGIDPQGQGNPLIGCAAVEVGPIISPKGRVDGVTWTTAQTVQLLGWAFDPDVPNTSVQVAIYRDGVGVGLAKTDAARPDVNSAFGITGDHGFDFTLPGQPAGTHTYCIYAIDNNGLANNTTLGCQTVVVPARSPLGAFDSVTTNANLATINGWAFDLDNSSKALNVAIYIDGVGVGWYLTDLTRADVNSAYQITGTHGYSINAGPLTLGPHQVCVYAIDDTGAAANVLLGCRSAVVK